jgi:AcrR family transcriptional regulator
VERHRERGVRPPGRGRGLSREEIVTAAIAVADTEGPDAISMRRIARDLRAGLLRHPWIMEYAASRPPTGPNDLRNLELMLGMVDGLGLDARTMVDILMTVNTYVMGAVLREVQEIGTERARAEREAAMTAAEIDAEGERYWSWLNSADDFPHIQRMVEAQVDPDSPDTRDERFDFGLDSLLDGIAARLPARPH